jgi:hypothetical protein
MPLIRCQRISEYKSGFLGTQKYSIYGSKSFLTQNYKKIDICLLSMANFAVNKPTKPKKIDQNEGTEPEIPIVHKYAFPPLPTVGDLIRLYGLSAKQKLAQNFLLNLKLTGN